MGAFEILNITAATYFMFLIPELSADSEKVIYIHTDTIIKRELGDLFKYDMKDLFFTGVKGRIMLSAVWDNDSKIIYWNRLKKSYGKYIMAGMLLMNL